jgi:hypothetical protein
MRLKDNQQMALDNQPNPVTPSPDDLKRMFEHPVDPAERLETASLARKNRNKKIALVTTSVVAGVGVLAAGGALVANIMRGPSQGGPNPVDTQTAQPSSSPEATTPTIETMPNSLQQFVDMPHEQFWALTPAERAPYCTWINRDLETAAATWYGITQNPLDKLPVSSNSNTAQEKVQIAGYSTRGAFFAHQNGNEVLNPETEKKALSCAYTDMKSPIAQRVLAVLTNGDNNGGNQFPAGAFAKHNDLLADSVTSFEAPVTTNGVTTQNMVLDEVGNVLPITMTTVHAKDYKNNPVILHTFG